MIGKKELGFNKQMAQVAAHIAHGFKSKLTFFYEETNSAKQRAEKVLEKENQGEDPLHHLTWTVTRVAQLKEEEKTGKKPLVKSLSTKIGEKIPGRYEEIILKRVWMNIAIKTNISILLWYPT